MPFTKRKILAALLALAGAAALAQEAPAELKFRDFFKLPIGPLGLEPTARLLQLQGQQVRLLGYRVKQDEADASAGLFLLTPLPITLGDEDERFADDLPATTIYIHFDPAGPMPPYQRGLIAVTGRLEIGAQAEEDGRQSALRLRMSKLESLAPNPRQQTQSIQ